MKHPVREYKTHRLCPNCGTVLLFQVDERCHEKEFGRFYCLLCQRTLSIASFSDKAIELYHWKLIGGTYATEIK
jgi:hypothetical protein